MARETFISYKYSDAVDLRDRIIYAMGPDARFYNGERADSPNMGDLRTQTIKEKLAQMIFGSSVTIVIISPYMKDSHWIDWEIAYSLRMQGRSDITSRTNGVVGVIMEVKGSVDWFVQRRQYQDGCIARSYEEQYLYEIIRKNRSNQRIRGEQLHTCDQCRTVDQLMGSYIALVDEDAFLGDYERYIENAYEKSQKLHEYELVKRIDESATRWTF